MKYFRNNMFANEPDTTDKLFHTHSSPLPFYLFIFHRDKELSFHSGMYTCRAPFSITYFAVADMRTMSFIIMTSLNDDLWTKSNAD